MGMPALKLEFEEITVEERSTSLEPIVVHIQSDVTEMKADIRRLDGKIDAVDKSLSARIDAVDKSLSARIDAVDKSLSARIDAVDKSLSAKIDRVDGKLDAFKDSTAAKFDAVNASISNLAISTEKGFSKMVLWVIGLVGVLLTVLARGFHWL
jgi:outer membrane murein-binding lipoprotein Lpp